MEWSRDQRLSLASLHLARTINEESSELTELFFSARMYNMCYPPEIQALIDERMVRVQMELHDIIRIGGRDLREAIARKIRIVQGEEQPPPPPDSPGGRDETMDSLTSSQLDPGPPLRASTPAVSEDGDEILMEETLPVDRTQGNSEGEEETEEWRQEREMRDEANEKEEEARRMLHRAWKEARRLEDDAA